MADEQEKEPEKNDVLVLSPGAEEVRTRNGGTSIRVRGEDGKFIAAKPKQKPMVPQREISRKWRNYLLGRDGNEIRLTKLMRTSFESAINCLENPETAGNGAKIMEVIFNYAGFAKATKTEEELEAANKGLGQVTQVVINVPPLLHPEVVEEKPAEPLKQPDFIDAEIVSDKE